MVLFSMAGTVLAAWLAAALARHLRPELPRPSLWITGLATPLLFDGYLVIAHTLGAAAAAGAVLLAVRATEDRRRRGLAIAGAAGCVVIAVLLRNEAVFWGVALGVALGVLAYRRRSRVLAGAAVAMVGAAGLAHLGEAVWIDRILGGHAVALGESPDKGIGLVAGRAQSIVLTWFRPGYGLFQGAELALVLMLAAIVAGGLAARRRPPDRRAIMGLLAVAAVASLGAFAAAPTNLVPGLLVACPLIAAGLVVLRRSSLREAPAQVAFGTFALFAFAVIATQYARGGSGEWGGRYFALGLPVLIPVVLLALADAGALLDGSTRRAAAGALVVCSLSTTAMGLTSLSDTHRFTARFMATVDQAGRGIAGVGEKPVLIATSGAVPRLAWATFDRQRWLLADPGDLGPLAARLRTAGVDRLVLVTDTPARDLAELGPGLEVISNGGQSPGGRWHVVQLRLT